MYFASRMQAGRMLAAKLVDKYRYENCAVIALSDGGVVVGSQIAIQLHCVLTLLNTAEIHLPQEPMAIAGITSEGSVAYNSQYSKGDIEKLLSENRNLVEAQKLSEMHKLNQNQKGFDAIDKRLLKGRNIILVADGLKTAFSIDLAYEFLKPISVDKLIFAVPFANIKAVDRMHVLGDELICLNVLEDFQDIDHYYDEKDIPDHEVILRTIEKIVLQWK
jgi:putative phosphoribosyl transferase